MISQWPRGHEKAPDTPFSFVISHGVRLESRYGKSHEIKTMQRVVERMHPNIRSLIYRVFCDSKATWVLEVELKPSVHIGDNDAMVVGAVFGAGMAFFNDGHNGIYVTQLGKQLAEINPEWEGEEGDDDGA